MMAFRTSSWKQGLIPHRSDLERVTQQVEDGKMAETYIRIYIH